MWPHSDLFLNDKTPRMVERPFGVFSVSKKWSFRASAHTGVGIPPKFATFSTQKTQISLKFRGSPHQSADWFAMTGSFLTVSKTGRRSVFLNMEWKTGRDLKWHSLALCAPSPGGVLPQGIKIAMISGGDHTTIYRWAPEGGRKTAPAGACKRATGEAGS